MQRKSSYSSAQNNGIILVILFVFVISCVHLRLCPQIQMAHAWISIPDFKNHPRTAVAVWGGGFYLSQSFLFISGFLLQPPSCVFEHFLHFPDLFSDFDIFHPFVNVCFVMSGRKNNIVWGAISQYACFPKKSICNFTECTLISMALFGV